MTMSARIRKQRVILLVCLLLILITAVVGMSWGYSSLSFKRVIPVLFGQGTFKEDFVLFSVRLPRILITLLAGMALALSGSILQSITRNDLADPGIIGINSGAGVAVAIFFLYFPIEAGTFVYMLPLAAFIGALLTAALIYLFSYSRTKGLDPLKMVLVGVGFSMALSGIMIVIISSAERSKVDFIAKWISGNIWGADWPFIWALLPWLIVLIPLTLFRTRRLDLMGLNEETAIGVGLKLERERLVLMVIAVAAAASAVSVTGGIAFIGLMAPHIAKALVGPRNSLFIPVAVLLGGWLLLIADTVGRNLVDPDGIAAGIMVSLIGVPYFVYLLLKK
ncbi:iron complex transport system permease protein [Paenibacillus pabuli]|uniref:Iron complex transport system permease protein n=1 Tax=Paenibacillus pabuli TaxID=1472 RepID=A0ABX9BKL3_9BACL|nr:iron ABC transporter permease [Paenibacillus pabuli]RAI97049.1 iron complex transport system permease protein [Paenibacillus pabuli]